jgi:hypothetical protein
VLPLGSIVTDGATGAGLLAASIAVFGFLGQVQPVLARRDDPVVRIATTIGGIAGFFVGVAIIVAEAW